MSYALTQSFWSFGAVVAETLPIQLTLWRLQLRQLLIAWNMPSLARRLRPQPPYPPKHGALPAQETWKEGDGMALVVAPRHSWSLHSDWLAMVAVASLLGVVVLIMRRTTRTDTATEASSTRPEPATAATTEDSR